MSFIFWGIVVALVVDVLLVVVMAIFPDIAPPLLIGFTGWVVAQCGLCCTAFQRSLKLTEGAVMTFFGLVVFGSMSGIVVLAREDDALAAMGFFAALIAGVIGLFLHTVPLLIVHRLIFRNGRTQFSIWQIMVATALIGVVLMLFMVAGKVAGWIGWIILFLFGPTVLAGLVLNYVDRAIQFLPIMGVVLGIACISLLIQWPESLFLGIYLIPQTLGAMLGGLILLQVPRSGPHLGDPLPSSFADSPGPFDEMEAAAESDFS
ncbi:hypothetical protein [Blastopirellula marina]|uniref:Uncharacterized protein n=1 Tax=Blastopirellula marina TaxID=124 RepID=A0A2S8GPF0_9BACT|nr:hypothetical protein [Blastopirellula marina]PQO46231.1 hypothetical protein C5Y93_09605 [Blastopirellula marina]